VDLARSSAGALAPGPKGPSNRLARAMGVALALAIVLFAAGYAIFTRAP
jgi:hypothetical protein